MFKQKAEIKYKVLIPEMDELSTIIYCVDNMWRLGASANDFRDVFENEKAYHSLINARITQLKEKKLPTKLSKLLDNKRYKFNLLMDIAEYEAISLENQKILNELIECHKNIQDGPF